MKLDKFNNPIFNDEDIFNAIYEGNILKLPELMVENSEEINILQNIAEFKFTDKPTYDHSIEEYDLIQQSSWFMPSEYYTFDIKEYCISKCTTEHQVQRVNDEINAYESQNLIQLLQWLKYFVDTCNDNNIFWGVGRGSSVSSYVLYLIGVHRIDSIKYNLDWKEFLR